MWPRHHRRPAPAAHQLLASRAWLSGGPRLRMHKRKEKKKGTMHVAGRQHRTRAPVDTAKRSLFFFSYVFFTCVPHPACAVCALLPRGLPPPHTVEEGSTHPPGGACPSRDGHRPDSAGPTSPPPPQCLVSSARASVARWPPLRRRPKTRTVAMGGPNARARVHTSKRTRVGTSASCVAAATCGARLVHHSQADATARRVRPLWGALPPPVVETLVSRGTIHGSAPNTRERANRRAKKKTAGRIVQGVARRTPQ